MKVIYPLGEVILEDFSFHRQNSIVPFLLYISQGNPVGSIGIFMDYIWWINYNPQCALMSYFGLEGLKKRYKIPHIPVAFPMSTDFCCGCWRNDDDRSCSLKKAEAGQPSEPWVWYAGILRHMCFSKNLSYTRVINLWICKYLFFNITLDTMMTVWFESVRLFSTFKIKIDKIFKDRQRKIAHIE